VIIGGDIGPRGGKFHGHELVEFNSKDVVKQLDWFLNEFFPLVEEFFGARSSNRIDSKLFVLLGNSDWRFCERELEKMFESNARVMVMSGAGDVFKDESVEILFTSLVIPSTHRKKDWERVDLNKERKSVKERERYGFISSKMNDYASNTGSDDEVITAAAAAVVVVEDYDMMGAPENERPTIEAALENLRERLSSSSSFSSELSLTKIFVNHGPPKNTIGDLTQRNERAGSRALRNFIADVQPDVTLHGHIHESVDMHGTEGVFTSKIGKTIVASSGNDFLKEIGHAIFFETKDIKAGKIIRYEIHPPARVAL